MRQLILHVCMFQSATLLQQKINLFQVALILLNCHQQMCICWPYCLVDNYVWDRCHITLILYKMDTPLRQTVKASPEGVRLGEV